MNNHANGITAAAGMQLGFTVINQADGKRVQNVIYITDSSSYNLVTLQIQLSTGSTSLTPGQIPAPSNPPSSGTTFYVDLSALQMDGDTWDNLKLSATNWEFQMFPSEGVFGMTPTTTIPFASGAGGVINVSIKGITVPKPLSSLQVQVYTEYYNVPGVDGMYGTFAVALQNTPSGKDNLGEAITATLSIDGIVNSPTAELTARNAFGLQFTGKGQAQVTAGPDTVFTVGFVYGAARDSYGFGALTDVDNANLMTVAAGLNAEGWQITQDSSAQSPCWLLQPPDGSPIVGVGAQQVVQINFGNLVTTYQPGPTCMLIAYSNVPGYRDGTFVVVLNKVAHAQIKTLQVSPQPAVFDQGQADVTVSWATAGAQSLALTQAYETSTVTGQTEVGATLNAEKTPFTLTATGQPGTVDNTDRRTVVAYALPVINSFTGTPTDIYAGSLSHEASFAWAVDSSDGVTLRSSGPAFDGQTFGVFGATSVQIRQPQMVTLAPTTALKPLTLTRRLVISAFSPQPAAYTTNSPCGVVAVSPTGPYVLVGGAGSSGLNALDTVQYSSVGTVATGHVAQAVVFSAGGGTVAALNTDNTVSIFAATVDATGLPSFGAASTVNLGGPGRAIIFSPNGPRLFVTVGGAAAGDKGQVVSLLQTGGEFEVEASVTVGQEPMGLTMDAAGSRLFVANQGDDTLSMIGLTSSGAMGGAQLVQQVTGGPTGIAASPSGRQILVSCAKRGTVVVLDPDHPNTGQRKTLSVGNAPGAIGIIPNGAYAFVVNGGDGSLSLIDCSGLPSSASVQGTVSSVGASPAGLAVSPDGQQVLVANSTGLSVVTLATYQASSQTPPGMPNQPNSVEFFPGEDAVAVWHDASLPASGPAPGILLYSVQSGTTQNLLADKSILRCVASPDSLSHLAFAVVKADPTLYIIDTASLDITPIPLKVKVGTVPLALAVSGDGDTAWIVCTDASHALSLVVFKGGTAIGAIGWRQSHVVPLYTAAGNGRFLLRATPDGTSLFLVEVNRAQVRAIRAAGSTYQLDPTVITGDVMAQDLAVSPDGVTAFVLNAGSRTNTVTVVDVASLGSRVLAIPQAYVNLRGLQFSPDGRRMFTTDSNAGALRVLDPASLRIIQTLPLAADPQAVNGASGLVVAPDASLIFTANTVSQTLGIMEQIQMGGSSQNSGLLGSSARLMKSLAEYARSANTLGDVSSALLMRHALGETPTAPTTGWSGSPDIIPYGLAIAPDPSIFTSATGYNTDYGAKVWMSNKNFVYVRGLNVTNAPITSRVYFYSTRGSLALWPVNWSPANVTVNTKVQNWVDVTAPVKGGESTGVGVAPVPLVWEPPALDPGTDHYCVIGWVDNSANPQPPDLSKWNFDNFDDLVNFVTSHHNMAWRNTVDVVSPPPDHTYTTQLPIPNAGAQVFLSISFPNIPLDGTFAVNVQGTDASNSVSLGPSPLSNYHGGFTPRNNPLVFEAGFITSVVVQHWPGCTPVPDNARIKVTLNVQNGFALMNDIERRYAAMGRRSPYRRFGSIPTICVGSTIYNLKFGAAKPKETDNASR